MDIGTLTGAITLEDAMTGVLMKLDQVLKVVDDSSRQAAEGVKEIEASMSSAAKVGAYFGNILASYTMQAVSWIKGIVTGSLMAGARLEQLGVATRFLGEQAGYTNKYVDDLAAQIEHSGISGIASRESIQSLLGAHIDLANAAKLSAIAQNMQSLSGKSSSEVFQTLTRALATGNTELLRGVGFQNISLEGLKAQNKAATGYTGVLSGQQRTQMMLNAILAEGNEKMGLYNESMTTAGKQASSAERAWDQVSEQLGTILLPVTNEAIKAWYAFGSAVRDAVKDASGEVSPGIMSIADALQSVIKSAAKFGTEAVPYIISFFKIISETVQIMIDWAPVWETILVALVAYKVALIAGTAATWLSTAAETAYAFAMGAAALSTGAETTALDLMTIAIGGAATAAGVFTVAIGAIFLAWKVGNMRRVSDEVAYWALRLTGTSSELAHLTINSQNAAEDAKNLAKETASVSKGLTDEEAAAKRAAIEQARLAELHKLSAEEMKKVEQATSASITKTAGLWETWTSIQAKMDEETLASKLSAINRWENGELGALEKSKKYNQDYQNQLAAIQAVGAQKRVEAAWEENKKVMDIELAILKQVDDASTASAAKSAANREALQKIEFDKMLAGMEAIRTARVALDNFIDGQVLSSTDYQIAQIQRATEAQMKAYPGLEKDRAEYDHVIRAMAKAQVDALYIDNKALTDNSNSSLQDIANKAEATYDAMAADPENYSLETRQHFAEIAAAAQDAANGVQDSFGKALGSLSGLFTKLGQIAGGTLGSVFSGVGQAVVQLEAAHTATNQISAITGEKLGGNFGQLSVAFDKNASSSQRMAAGIASAAAIAQGAISVWDATGSHATRAGNAMGGAMAGAQAGAAFGPWGIAIGAAAGLVVGLVRGKPAWARAAEEVGKDFGVKISDELAKAIAASAKKDFGGSRQAAGLSHLADIIKEAGGLTDKNLGLMTGKLNDVFSMIETHQMTIEQGTKVLDENFQAFAVAGTNNLGMLDKKLVETIQLNQKFGTDSKAITDYVNSQLVASAQGFAGALAITNNAYAERAKLIADLASQDSQRNSTELQAISKIIDLQKRLEKETSADKRAAYQDQINQLIAKGQGQYEKYLATQKAIETQTKIIEITQLHSQSAASAVASSLVGIVNANMAAGASFIDSVRAIGPNVTALQAQLEATGYSGGAAFDFIRDAVTLANDAVAGPALSAVEGYTAGMVGLSNAGALNQETFAGLAEQIGSTEAALVNQGFSSDAVMLAMKGDLQTIWEMQQQYGYSVDDSTQALIDQGVQSGLIGEQGKSDNQKILDVLMAIGKALGADIPEGLDKMVRAGKTAAGDVKDSLDKIPRKLDIAVNTHYKSDGEPPEGVIPDTGVPGGGNAETVGGAPSVSVAGLNRITPSATANPQSAKGGGGKVVIQLDRRTLAELVVPEIPGVVQRYGLGR